MSFLATRDHRGHKGLRFVIFVFLRGQQIQFSHKRSPAVVANQFNLATRDHIGILFVFFACRAKAFATAGVPSWPKKMSFLATRDFLWVPCRPAIALATVGPAVKAILPSVHWVVDYL
jgi:hypothetical protein